MNFEIIDEIKEIETIATGAGIRDLNRLKKHTVLEIGER
jgi:hypothetical protein